MKSNNYLVLILLLTWSCANRIQPTGGPKDEAPPQVITSNPIYGERNYHGLDVAIEFNEFINIRSLKEQLIITPRIEGGYDFKVRKRTIYLEFEEPFADSTTYTLNFREGIVDITERNPAKNLSLAFSTGNLLDTLEISGTVVDLMTKSPVKSAIVGLYPVDDTLDIFTGPPYYFTQTTEQGKYEFKNIKDGDYRLYAFDDGNKNLMCESEREGYAFLTKTITLDTAYIADTLNMQFLNLDTLELSRVRVSGRYFNVLANKYLTSASLSADNDSTIVFKYTEDHKGLKVYNTFPIKDSIQVIATLQDSLGMVVTDSFHLKFNESTRKADEFKLTTKIPAASKKTKLISGEITFNKPLRKINLDSISIKRDSIEQYLVVENFNYTLDSLENILSYSIDIPTAILDSLNIKADNSTTPVSRDKAISGGKNRSVSNAIYNLSIPSGAFISIEDDSSKAINKQIKFINPATTGLINGSVTSAYNSFTIQLLDTKMNVVKEHQNSKTYVFDEISPGEYYIRILVDENENGTWDLADIRQNLAAEKVILYQDETGISKTVIRANWELTVDLSF